MDVCPFTSVKIRVGALEVIKSKHNNKSFNKDSIYNYFLDNLHSDHRIKICYRKIYGNSELSVTLSRNISKLMEVDEHLSQLFSRFRSILQLRTIHIPIPVTILKYEDLEILWYF